MAKNYKTDSTFLFIIISVTQIWNFDAKLAVNDSVLSKVTLGIVIEIEKF